MSAEPTTPPTGIRAVDLPGMPAKPTLVVDGRQIDRVVIKFSQGFAFPIRKARDIERVHELRLDDLIEGLSVDGIVTGRAINTKRDSEGEVVARILTITIGVEADPDDLDRVLFDTADDDPDES